jgi:integrase
MAKNGCPIEPNPAYRDFDGVFPNPYRKASGAWVMRYNLNLGTAGRPTIQGEPGTQEFAEAYHRLKAAAANGTEAPEPKKLKKLELRPGDTGKGKSLDWAVQAYFGSKEYERLGGRAAKHGQKRHNQLQRRRYLEVFANARTKIKARRYGDYPFDTVEKRHIEFWLDGIKASGRHASMGGGLRGGKTVRDAHLGAVRVFYNWLIDRGLTKQANPAGRIEVENKKRDGGHLAVDVADLDRFRKRWPIGSMPRLAFALLILTGVRRSDVIRFANTMPDGGVRDGLLRFTATKGSESDVVGHYAPKEVKREIRMPAEMLGLIKETTAAVEADTGVVLFPNAPGTTWLRNASGRPFGYGDFGKRWREWCRAAGIKGECKVHSMRAAHAIEIYRRTKDVKAVQAALGHANLATTELYLRSLKLDELADDARVGLVDAI